MSTSSKFLMALTGAAFIALGVLCICYPGATLLSASMVIGIITLVSGISTIALWFKMKYILPTGNLLLSGIFQLLIGILFLNHNVILATALPIAFAMWLASEGLILAIRSFDFKKFNFSRWWVLLVTGVLLFGAGFYALLNPIDVAAPALSYTIGACIALFGIVDIVALFGIAKIEKTV